MTREEEGIRDSIRKIAGGGAQLLTGVYPAQELDGSGTCTVILSINEEDAPTEGVLLNGCTEDGTAGIYPVPAANSQVWVAELDGGGKYGIVRWGKVERWMMTINDVKIEATEEEVAMLQGATEVRLKAGKVRVKNGSKSLKVVLSNILDHVMALTVPTGVGPSGVPINIADFTTDKADVNALLY